MKDKSALLDLIGEDNAERLKSGVTDLILDRVRSDLDDYNNYILYMNETSEFLNDALDSTRKKIAKMYKDATLEINRDYIDRMKEYVKTDFTADKILRGKVLALAKKHYWLGNEYSKDRKFAEELFDVLNLTEAEIKKEMGDKDGC